MKVVFDLDDLSDIHDPYEELVALKKSVPGLKVTLFAIPGMCSEDTISKYKLLPWVELAQHGFFHSNMECYDWSEDEAEAKIIEGCARLGLDPKVAGFKAPQWTANGQTYKAKARLGGWVADHPVHSTSWLQYDPVPRYVVDMADDLKSMHGHTWEVCGNGPSWWSGAVAELSGAEFAFVSEAVEQSISYDKEQEDDCSWSHKTIWGEHSAKNMIAAMELLKPTGAVIDLGGNDGFAAAHGHASSGAEIHVMDSSPFKVAHAKHVYSLGAKIGTLEEMPYDDDAFEWGFCSHTLEHIDDLTAALSEIRRVCQKGCYVVVPVEDEASFDNNLSHKRFMCHEEWLRELGAKEITRTGDELTCLIRY